MACGMVRKVDELGRVVIPKEMRRVLNIKTGSSVEMFINNDNQVVLKKFSEISNILLFAENLADVIFDSFKLPCLIADEEKVLLCKGVNKKEYINKVLNFEIQKNKDYFILTKQNFLNESKNNFEYVYVFNILCDGFECGFIFLLSDKKLEEEKINKLVLLKKFLSNILQF